MTPLPEIKQFLCHLNEIFNLHTAVADYRIVVAGRSTGGKSPGSSSEVNAWRVIVWPAGMTWACPAYTPLNVKPRISILQASSSTHMTTPFDCEKLIICPSWSLWTDLKPSDLQPNELYVISAVIQWPFYCLVCINQQLSSCNVIQDSVEVTTMRSMAKISRSYMSRDLKYEYAPL